MADAAHPSRHPLPEASHTDQRAQPVPAVVRTIRTGEVMCEVALDAECGLELVATITAESARRLGLEPGRTVIAVVKSTEVMVAVND